jgi:hypothetical protein
MEDFVKRGGSIHRIFFADRNYLHDAEAIGNYQGAKRPGHTCVRIHYVGNTPRLRKHFVVEEAERICWETPMGPGGMIQSVYVTCDKATAKDFMRTFQELRSLECTERYSEIAHKN